jgi:hypothetical protein
MTDRDTPTAADDATPPAPPTCEELDAETRSRPRSVRLLPRICHDAVRLVWTASCSGLAASFALKLVNGVGVAVARLLGRDLVASVLASGDQPGGMGTVVPVWSRRW